MAQLRALVFDLDDTLHPELAYVKSGFEAVARLVCKTRPFGPYLDTLWSEFIHGDRTKVFDALLARHPEVRPYGVPELVQAYRAHLPEIRLDDGTRELLVWARAAGLGLALISDGYAVAQGRKVEALGLAGLVDLIVLTDQWGREFWKPHPRAFEEVQAYFGVRGEALAYVGDNPLKDFLAPNRLGWRTIRYIQAGQLYTDKCAASSEGEAAFTANSVAALQTLVRTWV